MTMRSHPAHAAELEAVLKARDIRADAELESLEQALLERDQALSALQDLHDRYEALLRAQSEVGECFAIVRDSRIIYANEAYCALTGFSSEELLALPDVGDLLHSSVRDSYQAHVSCRDPEAPIKDRYETLLARKDGTPVEVEVVVRGTQAGPYALHFTIIREITEKKRASERLRESEARYRLLFEHSSDAVLIASPEEGVLTANPAACKVFGYTVEEFRRLRRAQLVDASDPRFTDAAVARELTGQFRGELTLIRKGGERFPAEVASASFEDQDGRLTSGMIIRDITERRMVERMKDEFISVVSHELRTPLTALRGALGLLSGDRLGSLSAQGDRMLAIALGNAERLMRLVNDILDVERMATGHLALAFAEVDAGALLIRAAEAMRALALEAEVTLEVRPVAHGVRADEDRIMQALTNLLSNAIKFSPPGGIVTLGAEPQGDLLRFSIADEGRGIPFEMQEAVFERFRQVDASDSREKGGTGLGLPICRSIVEQHGGRIWAASRVGAGSTFHFTLPRVARGENQP
ncbi:MAG TPA: PAS domain S-box protein [Pantanalinema sp.]